jgi:ribosomal protein L29
MPIVRIKELTSMSTEDRSKKLVELRTELARMRTMVRAGGSVENPTRIYELRKAVAQVLTVENQEKRKAAKTAAEKPKKKETAAKKPSKPKEKKETAK